MDFSFLAIASNIKKMCAKIRKEGMDWLIKLFYDPIDTLFRHLRHINQRNLQNIVA